MKASRKTSALQRCVLETLESRQLMAAGDLDQTFGVGGKIIAEAIGFPVADIAVQADGKIIAVGTRNGDFAVARLNANGTLDRAFGGNGISQTDLDGTEVAKAVIIQPNGKIIVAGSRGSDGDERVALARYNPNGILDNTFDGNGKLIIDSKGSRANALALQSDGKILVAGGLDSGRVNINDNFAVFRLLPNGSLDSSFGANTTNPFDGDRRTGKTEIGFGADTQGEEAKVIALAPDGKIVVGGLGGNDQDFGPLRLAVARLNSDGRLDSSFGDGISGTGKFNNLVLFADFRDLHVASDNSVTIAGTIHGNFLTVRLKATGVLDKSFGGTGHIETNLGANDGANHTFVNREGILVAGGSSGKFAMVRYRLNGQRDPSFGQGGTVITPMAGDDAILTSILTSDGKLLAYGRSGSVARYFTAVPKVNVFSLDPDAIEGRNDNASLIFTRDLRLSFPTKVFFDLGGDATLDVDYNGPSTLVTSNTSGALRAAPLGGIGGLVPVGGLLGARIGFVEIPENETTVVVPINIINDSAIEPTETVQASIRTNSAYSLGDRSLQTIDIADNDIVRVNFQSTTGINAFGYAADLGLPFGPRDKAIDPLAPDGLRFGWDVDNTANARFRGLDLPGFIYNTFNHMQKNGADRKWEIALPNGMYEVKLAAGDPQNVDSVYRMNLEGQLALSGTPANRVRWFERTVRVQVNDGRLTLSNATGAVNNKIAFIEIKSAAPGAVAGPVTDNVPVSLPIQPVGGFTPPSGGTIFSQLQI